MDNEAVRRLFEEALAEFQVESRYLMEVDSSEQNLTGDLSRFLRTRFLDWNVDCEYNRNREAVKRLVLQRVQKGLGISKFLPGREYPRERVAVIPDIIVHRRGTDDNLLVVEAKKHTTSSASLAFDRAKLGAYVEQLGYRFAALLMLKVGNDPAAWIDYWIEGMEP